MRWARRGRRPDGPGPALWVHDTVCAVTVHHLLLTSSGSGCLGRHLPLLRCRAFSGPSSTLLAYRRRTA